MSRYIDAKKMEEWVRKEFADCPDFIVPWLIRMIRKQPTADVQEVKHGKWDEIRDGYGRIEGWIHKGCGRMSMGKDKYCPKCGAKMDLEPEERKKLE